MERHAAWAVLAAVFSLSLVPQAWSQEVAPTESSAAEAIDPVVILGNSEHTFWATYGAIYAGLREVQKQQADLAPRVDFRFLVTGASNEGQAAGKPIRVALIGSRGELEVSRDGATPFRFPLDETLAAEHADIAISGAGPKPELRIEIKSPDLAPLKWRLGDARLVCAFLTAARKEAATGMNRLTLDLFGKYTCLLPVNVSSQEFQVFIKRKDGKEDVLPIRDGAYYFPAHISSYPNDAILEARPRSEPAVKNAS